MVGKRGRPPKPPSLVRDESLTIKLSEAERNAVEAAAKRIGEKPRVWARTVVLRAIAEVMSTDREPNLSRGADEPDAGNLR